MRRISTFYGIVIAIYCDDHAPPHFHAIYSVTHEPWVTIVEVLGDRRGAPDLY